MLTSILLRFTRLGLTTRVILYYLVASSLWILFSDVVARWLITDEIILTRLQAYKGLFFLFASAIVIVIIARRAATERAAGSLARRKSQALAEGTSAASPVAIWIHDFQEKKLIEVSGAVEDNLGYSSAELLAFGTESLKKTIHPDDYSEQVESFRRTREHWDQSGDNDTRTDTIRWVDNKGNLRWVQMSQRPYIRDEQGRVQQIIGSVLDITSWKKIEEDLKKEQVFTEMALNALADTFTVFDSITQTPLRWNRSVNELSGYSDQEIRNMKVPDDWYDAEDLKKAAAATEILRTDGVTTVEMSLLTKDGRKIPMEYKATMMDDDQGVPRYILSVGRNLTEQKRVEGESLKIIETSRDWVWATDLEGRYTYSNPAVSKILGYSPKDLIGTLNLDLLHPDDRRVVEASIPACISSRRGWDGLAFKWRHKDGHYRLLESSTVVILDHQNQVQGFRGVDRDITNLHRAHNALRQERDRAQGYLDLAGVMFVALNADQTVSMANPKCCEVLQCPLERLIGHNWFDDFIPKADREQTCWAFEQLMAGEIEPVETFENSVRVSNGEERLIAWHNSILRDEQGVIIGTLSSGEDITESRQAEIHLQEAADEIRKLKEKVDAENVYLRQEIKLVHQHGEIVSHSREMKAVLAEVEQVAKTDSTVLVLGETGTGKELLVRAIHAISERRDRPLVIVNCAAMPSALVESELFGREKGAYTGALTRKVGRFEIANGGTFFLDEIGELSAEIQAKLLRVIQEGEFERLGSNKTIHVDIRLLAATNRDLAQEVRNKNFREDLFYRLNVFPISIPPLRERREDIEPLIWTFVNEFAEKMGKRVDSISQNSLDALMAYSWPGNVRELRNVVERAMIVVKGQALDIPLPVSRIQIQKESRLLRDVEKEHILTVVKLCQWRIRGQNGAAQQLGLNPSTLESRMLKLGIKRPS